MGSDQSFYLMSYLKIPLLGIEILITNPLLIEFYILRMNIVFNSIKF